MKLARRLLGIAVFVAVLVFGWRFAADHSGQVTIELPVAGGFDLTLWLALLLAVGLGAVLTGVAMTYQLARLRLVARRYRKVIKGLEAEVHQLRNLPLADGEDGVSSSPLEAGSDPVTQRALGRGA